ncbi:MULTISPECIES: hypothetical protein [Streptomyces]|uniref:IrrE N-terminal-like domain-containing protein n=1 Tax=Streptomyces yunnanensis TaxID=156453 RepID=A0ABY8A397_9ACTN|nr:MULTISPECIES: hypothetical protein [Streptomyces]AJC54463.1 hypothetical protein GZL_01867 [Streptomyces sp. 769]WEB39258.1 hypothetical protein MOV08_08200 [Streptomyces yunnanensis]
MTHADKHIRSALDDFPIPDPLTITSLFEVVRSRYPGPGRLELWRGAPPLTGLRANGLWLTLPDRDLDAIWVAPELHGAAAVHTLAHEAGHIALGHVPFELSTQPEPEPYEYLSPEFLSGSLIGRPRSQDGGLAPDEARIEDEAEQFAFALRRTAADQAHARRFQSDPLLDRLHHSL